MAAPKAKKPKAAKPKAARPKRRRKPKPQLADSFQPPITPPPPPPRSPRTEKVEGWTVAVGRFNDNDLADEAVKLLGTLLYDARRRVPYPAAVKLQSVPIRVEENSDRAACAAYHPDRLEIEVSKARVFLEWTLAQPGMVLHELAHAYHYQFLPGGFANPTIKAAYDQAIARKLYAAVLYRDGRTLPAYAATNPMEYFAELSEAFFGVNEFYPFVRAELGKHDPAGFEAVQAVWGLP